MFIGHVALGLAAKRLAPRQSLAVLVSAPMVLDMLWPVFCAVGIERFRIAPGDTAYTPLAFDWYPWSHSLVMSSLWGALFALAVWKATGDRGGAIVAGALVVSHWGLDVVTHRPDMPLWPGGPLLGLGLWNNVAATIVIESLLFVAGVAVYLRATQARDLVGRVAFWALVVLLAVAYAQSSTGTPPPNVTAVVWTGIIVTVVMPLWLWWIDRHREVA
jgi:membrane-bound metal-dependent hydrolase YbcI (DUF457 family)